MGESDKSGPESQTRCGCPEELLRGLETGLGHDAEDPANLQTARRSPTRAGGVEVQKLAGGVNGHDERPGTPSAKPGSCPETRRHN
jgi:hypothetical protein